MTEYEKLLQDENAILRKRIAILEENNAQTIVDPQIQSELANAQSKNVELLTEIQTYKERIKLLTDRIKQLSIDYNQIDYTKLFIDKFTKQAHAIYLGEVNKNEMRHYDDSEWYDSQIRQRQSSSYYDEFRAHIFMLLVDGQVISIPYNIVKAFDMDNEINIIKKSLSSGSKLYEHVYKNDNNNFVKPLSPSSLVDNESLEKFIIDKCRQLGFYYEGKGISYGNMYLDDLYPEYQQTKEHNLTFSIPYTTQSGTKNNLNFTITPRDIIANYTKLESFILYENPLFSKYVRHEINQYFNHTITTSDDNKTTIVTNKDGKVVYQETLVTPEEDIALNNSIRAIPIPSSLSNTEDTSSNTESKKYAKWTPEEIELLKELTLQNVPPREIEKHPNINKTLSSIRIKLHALRANNEIPSSPLRIDGWSPEDDDILIEMFNDNEDPKAISIKLNKSLSAVTHRIGRLREVGKLSKLDKRRQNSKWIGREEDVETLKRLIKEGYRVKDMLQHLSHEYTYAQVAGKVNALKNLKNGF